MTIVEILKEAGVQFSGKDRMIIGKAAKKITFEAGKRTYTFVEENGHIVMDYEPEWMDMIKDLAIQFYQEKAARMASVPEPKKKKINLHFYVLSVKNVKMSLCLK